MPATRPMAAATRPTTTDSSIDRAEHLAAAGADGPEHGEVLDPLGDDDREGVVDDERADEEGDVGERHQERVEEADVLGEVGLLVGRVLLAGERLEAGAVDGDARRRCGRPGRRRVTPSSAAATSTLS